MHSCFLWIGNCQGTGGVLPIELVSKIQRVVALERKHGVAKVHLVANVGDGDVETAQCRGPAHVSHWRPARERALPAHQPTARGSGYT